jgi:hypothetical protein
VDHQCLDRVGAAAGGEAAARRQGRRDPPAVEPQCEHQHPNHRTRTTTRTSRAGRCSHLSPGRQDRHRRPPGLAALGALAAREPISRRNAPSRSSPSAALLAPADAGSARTTTSAPAGRVANRRRMRCRSRRCTRCRTTEPPTVRPTTKPTFEPISVGDWTASTALARARCTTTEPQAARRPRCTAAAKSLRRVSRVAAESKARYPPNANASGRQLSATLAAPGREDGSPGAGAHTQPEPVGPRAATVIRLERTLALGHGCRSPGARFSLRAPAIRAPAIRTGAIRTGGSRGIPCRHGRHCCERDSPGTRPTSGRRRGHARMPAVGGRRPERRPPVLAPSKPASRVTARATRRYIGGACLQGVLVAAPQAC